MLALFSLTACSSKEEKAFKNQNTLQIKEFEVSTDLPDANTVTQGNVYVQNSNDDITIIVVASIEIGENDWGGVQFYFPEGWNVTRALSSYRSDEAGGVRQYGVQPIRIQNGKALWKLVVNETQTIYPLEAVRELLL